MGKAALAWVLGAGLAVSAGPSLAQASAEPTPRTRIFENPVLRWDFPDPFLLRAEGGYYAYATNSAGLNIQVSTSEDLRRWSTPPREAMPLRPAWVRDPTRAYGADIWAPEVVRLGTRYVLYFSGRHQDARTPGGDHRPCIGAATSEHPLGPFKPLGHPLICAEFEEGAIDASPFQDGEKLYLYFKSDGNCCDRRTRIHVQELTPDGLDLIGDRVPLEVTENKPWEGRLVEAPTMIKRDGRYLMFYSANAYDTDRYAMGYAVCRTPVGPCTDAEENPVLSSSKAGRGARLIGPGHQGIIDVEGRTYVAYHGWNRGQEEGGDRCRAMYIDELRWQGERPVVQATIAPAAPWRCPRQPRRR